MLGRNHGTLLIAALLAGCGGGGGGYDDDSVGPASSSNVPQAQATPVSETQSSPATADSPAPQEDNAPQAETALPGTTTPAARALGGPIRGRNLSSMLRTDSLSERGGEGPVEVSPSANGQGLPIYVYQTGSYSFATGYRYEGRNPNFVFRSLEIDVLASYFNDSVSFDSVLVARSGEQTTRLVGSAAQVNGEATLSMGQTVHEWRSPVASEPWFARLQVQEHEGNRIRVCWQVLLPSVARLACHLYSESADRIVGAYVMDESPGAGRMLWQTQESAALGEQH